MKKIKYNEDNKWIFLASAVFSILVFLFLIINGITFVSTIYVDGDVAETLSQLTYTEDNAEAELLIIQKTNTRSFLSEKSRGDLYKAATEISYMFGNDELYNYYFAHALYYLKKTKNTEDYIKLLSNYMGRLYANGYYRSAKVILDRLEKDYTLSNYSLDNQANYYLTYTDVLQMLEEDSSHYLRISGNIISRLPDSNQKKLRQAKLDILKARQSILNGSFTSAKKIMSAYDENDNFEFEDDQVYVVCDFRIPYYEIMTKIELNELNYTKASYFADLYVTYCSNYKFRAMKLNLLRYIVNNVEDGPKVFYGKYNTLVKKVEREYFSEMTKEYGNFLMSDILSTMNTMTLKNEEEEKFFTNLISIVIILCILFLGFCIIRIFMNYASRDALTHLNNRRKYEQMRLYCKKRKTPYCFLMLDIDDFKKVNDTYGHAAGDKVLRYIARILRQYCGRGISAYRYGGEELCLFLLNVSENRSRRIAEEIRKTVAESENDNPCIVTVSIGVGVSINGEEAFQEADENLYKAKKNGKNQVV